MAKYLGLFAYLVVVVAIISTFFAIVMRKASATQLIELTEALVSWPVIAGGLAVAAGPTIMDEIRALLQRRHTA